MTEHYEKIIDDLVRQSTGDIDMTFEQSVWSRISAIDRRQLARGRNGLAGAMLIVALSAGLMTGEQEAFANSNPNVLSGGADYSPASLLRVSP